MKTKLSQRVLAALMAFVMVALMVPTSPMRVSAEPSTTGTEYVLDTTSDLTAIAQESKENGETEIVNNYFTLYYSTNTKVDGSKKTFDDGYAGTQRLNFGGASQIGETNKNVIKITTADKATVEFWFSQGGDDNRQVAIFNAEGTAIATSAIENMVKNSPYRAILQIPEAGTYYLGNPENNNNFFKIVVTEGAEISVEPETSSSSADSSSAEDSTSSTEATSSTEGGSGEGGSGEGEGGSQPSAPDNGLIDVWDFGFETLDVTKYNNMLDVAKANDNFYVNGAVAAAGSVNGDNTMGSWSIDGGDFAFVAAGKTNHRLRINAVIEGLTAHSSGKYLTDDNGVTYNGFLYSNAGGNADVQIQVKAKAGDILTFVHGSNGGDADVVFESPSGKKTLDTFTAGANSAHGEVSTFYCDVDGTYKFYYTSEKLVVARVTRQHTKEVSVTGAVTAPAGLTDYSLVLTCNESGAVVEASVAGGAYAATLREGYTYTVSLKDANGYIVCQGEALEIASGAQSATHDVQILSVGLVTVTGNITGLNEDLLAKLSLRFQADELYVPELTVTGATYTVKLEKGVAYTLAAEGINDYRIVGSGSVSYDADATADIAFEAKPTYAITIDPQGCTLADLAGATFTFTNLDEDGYVYTFTGTDAIALRDGTYSVKVANSGVYFQELTSNLIVNGEAVTKEIPFTDNVTVWNFADEDWAGTSPYKGLTFTNGGKDKTYLLAKAETISVPVKGTCRIQVTACYEYSFYFAADTEASVGQKTNSTSQLDTFTYDYTGAAGTVDITVLGQSYICKIEILDVVPFQDTVTVGATGCDYTTINDALDAVRKMERPNGERVTIAIQPGNYEEMLVIDIPNITLKNASASPSLGLSNGGVDIASNAVRITSYYGHGYHYYSMGSGYKWNAEVLEVNKANGYASTNNPGTGTGTYWNATVVVTGDNFKAEGIIFENSFNQYVSKKASEDVIIPNSGAKEGATPRADLPMGSTAVQDKKYVERAAALAIADGVDHVYFENCKFIGRQDTLYGGKGSTVAFYDCSIYGACDYIFGGMTAVLAKCDLVANTSEDGNDKFYITAPQTPSGSHGLLMWGCRVTSTVPGVDTASQYPSKPGYFGRPWAADSGEAVFYKTTIDATCEHWYEAGASLIDPEAWLSSLSGQSALCGEYGTYEYAKDVDNSASRASWAQVFTEETLASGEPISVATWFGAWDPFAGKDMTITLPTDKVDNKPAEEDDSKAVTYVLVPETDIPAFAEGDKQNGDMETFHKFFTVIYSNKSKLDGSKKTFDGEAFTKRLTLNGKTDPATMANSIKFTTQGASTVKIYWVCGGDGRQFAIYDSTGAVTEIKTAEAAAKNGLYVSELNIPEAGTYYLGLPDGSNWLFKLEVTDKGGPAPDAPVSRPAWADVAAPEILEVTEADGKFSIKVSAVIGAEGGDKLTVNVYNEAGELIDFAFASMENTESTLKIDAAGSGKYAFQAVLSREGEDDKKSAYKYYDYTLPLAEPTIVTATSLGGGKAEIVWRAVEEAEKYEIYADGVKVGETTTETKYTAENLAVGKTAAITVKAVRGEDVTESKAVEVLIEAEASKDKIYILDTSADLTPVAQGDKADGTTEKAGTDNYFTVHYVSQTKVDSSKKTFDDAYEGTQRLNFNGKAQVSATTIKNVVEFTTEDKATVTVWFAQAGTDNRQMVIYNAAGEVVAKTDMTMEKDKPYMATLKVPEAGTYYLGGYENKNYIFKIQVLIQDPNAVEAPRADWATVAAPAISGAVTENGEIKVTVNALVGKDGGDEVIVEMYDADGELVTSARSIAEKSEHTLAFKPESSGGYTFKVSLKREGEEAKTGSEFSHSYLKPLEAPVISSATSAGGGSVKVVWAAADEAESYNVYVDGKLSGNTKELSYTVSGLTVGTKYSFTVEAVRGEDKAMSAAKTATATQEAQQVWSTTIYGPSTNDKSNGVEGDINSDGKVTVYSEGGKGKLQYKDSDGLTYYYTAIPENLNFTFRVKVHVDSWKYSNGQEGFGIMATDSVAPNGESTWWSNQYMALISKIEYRYDPNTGKVFHTNVTDGVKYNLRLGVGTTAKLGITPENLPLIQKNDTNTILSVADGVTYPLDIGFAKHHSAGNYNVVGNNVDPSALVKAGLETVAEATDFVLEIQRNNTGYFITYYDLEGNIIGQQKNYDPKALSALDTGNVYVGFFAARNARATFTIEELSTIAPEKDAPAEEKPITYINPTLAIVSAAVTTDETYTLSVSTNVSGSLKIILNDTVIEEAAPITGGVRFDLPVVLTKTGNNRFYVTFTPDPNQDLGEGNKLSNSDPLQAYSKVSYNTKFAGLTELYVSPNGKSYGAGTRSNPIDIYTAVQNVSAGQTIVLMEGTYKLDNAVVIERGIDGTAEKPIRMIADPEADTRPVLDFKAKAAGITAAGSYWYFQGFDVTDSVNGKPGFHVCGSSNTLDRINAYFNGNTGIQISRYKGSDLRSEWPSNNLVLNCTSFGNADAGYEDADGFAAKLTCGDGNVFDGCVAYNNADDGWDLYAKVETGPIGTVVIRNCVAYSNGYLEDGTNAGNGNGFKMGGSNMPGAHKLINSYAFFNKAKGIDSNSGPDVIVENCTSFNNESYNVAFYTNINQNTNYQATGIISFKDATVKSGLDKADNLKPRGNQDTAKYLGETNYYWDGASAANTAGKQVTADMFVSLEFKGVKRNADGTIDLQGFLQLKDTAGVNAGAKPAGTPSQLPGTAPDHNPTRPVTPETGDMSNPALWAFLMLVTAMGMVMVPACLRKRGV